MYESLLIAVVMRTDQHRIKDVGARVLLPRPNKDVLMFNTEMMKPVLMGAVGGAVALAIVGFSWGGWVTGGTAEAMAKKQAKSATVAALAPICAAKFQADTGFDAKLTELNETRAYQRSAFIEKGGWATMPGNEKGDRDVAKACAEMIIEMAEA